MEDGDSEDLLEDDSMLDYLEEADSTSLIDYAVDANPPSGKASIHRGVSPPMIGYEGVEDDCCNQQIARNARPASAIGSAEDANLSSNAKSNDTETRFDMRSQTISRVEAIFEELVDVLLNERSQLSILLKRRTKLATPANGSTHSAHKHANEAAGTRICYPGRTEREAWRFSVLTRILELIHEALRDNVVLSKRDIFYRDPALFGKQDVVDRYVDDIAFTFSVPRSALNVTAVAKGLISGAVILHRRDGTKVDAIADPDGMLVPSLKDVLCVDMTSVRWILVIEKEATFRSIAASTFWREASQAGIIITAKGYPDIATRAMLRVLTTPSPQNGFSSPTVHGLVDFDPDGLAILSTYKYGSSSLAHESADLRVPQIVWLGLRSDHLQLDSEDSHAGQGLLALTPRDRRKARKMLSWDALADDDEARGELQKMLMLNIKAELQLLDAVSGGMHTLLAGKLRY